MVSGSAELLAPGVEPAETYFLMPGMDGAPEVRRKAEQIARAEIVVVPRFLGTATLAEWPEFAAPLSHFEIIHDGPRDRVYRRREPAAAGGL